MSDEQFERDLFTVNARLRDRIAKGLGADSVDMKMRADAWAGLARREYARLYLLATHPKEDTNEDAESA